MPRFFIQSENLSFFIGVVRSFTINVTINMVGFKYSYSISLSPTHYNNLLLFQQLLQHSEYTPSTYYTLPSSDIIPLHVEYKNFTMVYFHSAPSGPFASVCYNFFSNTAFHQILKIFKLFFKSSSVSPTFLSLRDPKHTYIRLL